MKKKVVLLPLDERPCNYDFPYKLFNSEDITIVRPEKLGNKKKSANAEDVEKFLIKECKTADMLVLSMDMLLYGGLIPSRLHHLSEEVVEERLKIVKQLKAENPELIIFAFQVIMRCPKYSSDDEEPDYYGICGEQIHKIGNIIDRSNQGLCDKSELDELYSLVKPEYLEDYTNRRKFNLKFNIKTLEYLKTGAIDFLIIPQDDSAKYGFTAMDQVIVRDRISEELLQDRVLMYPGADEVELTLLSRAINTFRNYKPKVYIKYASQNAPNIIPPYEDRTLGESVKYQLIAADCRIADTVGEADFVLAINCPGDYIAEAVNQPVKSQGYSVERNLIEYILFIEDCINESKAVTIGDCAYANGGDLELIALLNKRNLLDKVSGYAGWNTSANTLGTSIAQGVCFFYYKNTPQYYDFLMSRYVEDAGYCSVVRKDIARNHLSRLGMNYFDVKEKSGLISELAMKKLQDFIDNSLSSISGRVSINSVYMPWRRMFEIGIDVTYK